MVDLKQFVYRYRCKTNVMPAKEWLQPVGIHEQDIRKLKKRNKGARISINEKCNFYVHLRDTWTYI